MLSNMTRQMSPERNTDIDTEIEVIIYAYCEFVAISILIILLVPQFAIQIEFS